MVRVRNASSVIECPICMDPVKYAAETNCGHLFCGECILQVWQLNRIMTPICCPYCRQEVTMLLQCFNENEENDAELSSIETRESIKQKISQYNRFFCQNPGSFFGQLRDLPTILRHVWAEVFNWGGLEFFYKFRILLCLVVGVTYAIVPFDFIPEGILGLLGFIDDLIIILFLLFQVATFYRNYISGN